MLTLKRFCSLVNRKALNYSYINLLSTTSTEMTSQQAKTKIAVVQLNSTEDKARNFRIAQQLIQEATNNGARMAFLPECFDMICSSKKETIENGEAIDGSTVKR